MLAINCPECGEKDYIEDVHGETINCECGAVYEVDILITVVCRPD